MEKAREGGNVPNERQVAFVYNRILNPSGIDQKNSGRENKKCPLVQLLSTE